MMDSEQRQNEQEREEQCYAALSAAWNAGVPKWAMLTLLAETGMMSRCKDLTKGEKNAGY